jgi:hypothetical protein
MTKVRCEYHDNYGPSHEETPECVWPMYVLPTDGQLPSMTAVETLDPRDAVVTR